MHSTTPPTLIARQTTSNMTSTPMPPRFDTASPQVNLPTETQIKTVPPASATPIPTQDYFTETYPLSKNEYIIPLTIRHAEEERVTFFFELTEPASGLLIYRSNESNYQEHGLVEIPATHTRHMISVEGLSPGIRYQAMLLIDTGDETYQQPGFNRKEWGGINFRTTYDELPLRVGVLGDASFGDEATRNLVSLMASQDLDFVLHTGDVVYETDGSDLIYSYTTKYFEPFAPLLKQLPIYTVLGNHDYDAVLQWQGAPIYDYMLPPFPDPNFTYSGTRRGNQYYAFSYQNVQFLMLDSQVFFGVGGFREQETWLIERLADPRFRITIPVFHVSPYSSSVVHPNDGLPVRSTWNPLFEVAKVPIILSGHFHHYERNIANGLTYIVSGGGSSTLYAQGEPLPESQLYARRTHFVLLEIYEDRIQVQAISLDGEIIDQTVIEL